MSPQDFEEMDDGELVCFIGKKKRFRLKSMNAQRHPQLKKTSGHQTASPGAASPACRWPTGTNPSAKTTALTRVAL